MDESPLRSKSYAFAIRVVRLAKYLRKEFSEFVLSKQVLRSGTAIGALIHEAQFAQSNADFVNKMNIALKEANETSYWLSLLKDTDYLSRDKWGSMDQDCGELIAMLVATVKTSKQSKAS